MYNFSGLVGLVYFILPFCKIMEFLYNVFVSFGVVCKKVTNWVYVRGVLSEVSGVLIAFAQLVEITLLIIALNLREVGSAAFATITEFGCKIIHKGHNKQKNE